MGTRPPYADSTGRTRTLDSPGRRWMVGQGHCRERTLRPSHGRPLAQAFRRAWSCRHRTRRAAHGKPPAHSARQGRAHSFLDDERNRAGRQALEHAIACASGRCQRSIGATHLAVERNRTASCAAPAGLIRVVFLGAQSPHASFHSLTRALAIFARFIYACAQNPVQFGLDKCHRT